MPENLLLTNNARCHCCRTDVEPPQIQVCDNCRTETCPDCIRETPEETNYCEDCFHDEYSTCDHCSTVERQEDCTWHNEEMYCSTCAENLLCTCHDCEETIRVSIAINTSSGNSVCQSCYEDNYGTCESCNEVTHQDNLGSCECDQYLCDSCRESCDCNRNTIDLYSHADDLRISGHSAITDYHPKVEWIQHKKKTDLKSNPYFGIELEIEATEFKPLNEACKFLGTTHQGHVLCSYDGSLTNGFEIIFSPHKKEAFRKQNLTRTLKELSKLGCLSFSRPDPNDSEKTVATCGLHVHISRSAFGRPYITHKGITLTAAECYKQFFYIFRNDITKLSRRRQSQIDRYCSFTVDNGERYAAVNLCGNDTVEVRIWRGTLEPVRFRAQILFTLAVLDFLKGHSPYLIFKSESVLRRAFRDWLLRADEYQHLVKYLKSKKLFNL